jgi:serine-type D-Ala-D-Ala carboxypeptidase
VIKLQTKIKEAIEEKIFSGIAIDVKKDGTNVYSIYEGKTLLESKKDLEAVDVNKNSIFDIASLTKPLCTALITGILIDQGLLSFETKIAEIFDDYSISYNKDLDSVNIQQLLNHSSGLEPWFGLYTLVNNRSDAYMLTRTRPICYKPGTRHVYSDLGYIMLGEIIEIVLQNKLNIIFDKFISSPLGLENIFFIPTEDKKNNYSFVSTGYSKNRDKELLGEVNDENAYILNGVSGHAGLFSNADNVSSIAKNILETFKGKNQKTIISQNTLQKMLQKDDSEWCMGWHYPSKDNSTAGKLMSQNSIGMTGFTGTSLWIDLDRNIIISILANRTIAPDSAILGGEIDRFTNLRPLIHDLIIGELGL